MATTFPRFVLMKFFHETHRFFYYDSDNKNVPHCISFGSEKGAFDPLAKIEIEPAKIDSKYVHLRFVHINSYFAMNNARDMYIVAASTKPEEDKSKPSCTLFEPIRADDDGNFHLIHVHTGQPAELFISLLKVSRATDKVYPENRKFNFVDWDTIVKLPEHVAFKGDNGKYLQAYWQDDLPFLRFSSDDPYDVRSGFRVELRPDGYVRIKSDHTGKFWKLSPSWIWADEDRPWSSYRLDDAFWPTTFDDNTIALRNGKNSRYCSRLSVDKKKDCLNAAVSTATKETRLVVEELVKERKIYGLIYRLENARVLDERPFIAGETTGANHADTEANVEVEVMYEVEESHSFNRGFSITGGVKTSIQAGASFLAEGKVEVNFEVTGNFEWGTVKTKKKTVKATGKVLVPARSMGVIRYVGTKGTCNVPYSYTQQDTSSTDGKISYSVQNDGMYTGVSCYNFQFVMQKAYPI